MKETKLNFIGVNQLPRLRPEYIDSKTSINHQSLGRITFDTQNTGPELYHEMINLGFGFMFENITI